MQGAGGTASLGVSHTLICIMGSSTFADSEPWRGLLGMLGEIGLRTPRIGPGAEYQSIRQKVRRVCSRSDPWHMGRLKRTSAWKFQRVVSLDCLLYTSPSPRD
eukprot:15034460-Alexandrium_andersonii.AAC.1